MNNEAILKKLKGVTDLIEGMKVQRNGSKEEFENPIRLIEEVGKQKTLITDAATRLLQLSESDDTQRISENINEFKSVALSSVTLCQKVFVDFLIKYCEVANDQLLLLSFIKDNNLQETFEEYCRGGNI